jgi:nucleotide-binding universal stress UspA family protein
VNRGLGKNEGQELLMSGRIVVGVDDSAGAAAALRWALDEARLRQATLDVMHAWQPFIPMTLPGAVTSEPGRDNLEAAARNLVTKVVDDVVGPGDPPVTVRVEIGEGSPADVLVKVAGDADLSVVGSRGRGGFAGLLLGSVSQQVAHHAPCPVAIVPPPRESK